MRPRTTTTKKSIMNFQMPQNMEKFTAQQIIRQQMLNKQQQKNRRNNYQMDDMTAQPSDEFWLTLQTRGHENMQKMSEAPPMNNVQQKLNHMLFDNIAELNNLQRMQQNNPMKVLPQGQEPKLQFENIIPPMTKSSITLQPKRQLVTTATPRILNQFMLQEQIRQKQIEEMNKPTEKGASSIQIFNPGSSGLQTVQGAVPLDNDDQMFSVGASLTLGTGESTTASNMIPGEFCSTNNVEINYLIVHVNF